VTSKKEYYKGVKFAPYDLVKEFVVALGVVALLVVILAAALSSPDVPSVTMKTVAVQTPQNYTQVALDSLDGNSAVATYGPPYNNQTGSVQFIGPFSPQDWLGVHIPINTAQDFVLGPLAESSAGDSVLKSALTTFKAAPSSTQAAWETAYQSALNKAPATGSSLQVPACPTCGPVPVMMSRLLALGQSGAMDGLLLTSPRFFETDYTRPLLFINYTDAMANEAAKYNLLGETWGVMNETGNYPGQAWLWLYTTFYQLPPYTTAWAANTDALAIASVTILSLLLMFVPWIPGLNRIPRYIPVYRLIWRDYYRDQS
jgi:hypothetical protein